MATIKPEVSVANDLTDAIEVAAPSVVAEKKKRFRWWMPSLALFAVAAGLLAYSATSRVGAGWFEPRSTGWLVFTTVLHLPFFVIMFFLAGWPGRAPRLLREGAGA